jgi:hypothetical protein
MKVKTRKAEAAELASMQAADEACKKNLARAIKNAMNIEKELGDPAREGATIAMKGQMEDTADAIKGYLAPLTPPVLTYGWM